MRNMLVISIKEIVTQKLTFCIAKGQLLSRNRSSFTRYPLRTKFYLESRENPTSFIQDEEKEGRFL